MKDLRLVFAAAAAALALAACEPIDPADLAAPDDLATDVSEMRVGNSLETLDLVANGITGHAEAMALFISRPLAFDELPADDLVRVQLHDPRAKRFMPYLVGCALSSAQTVTYDDPLIPGTLDRKTWRGSSALCPAWKTSAPSAECLQLVSACVLARNNPQGVVVQLSMRGHRASGMALPVSEVEAITFDVAEGAFFGDLFVPELVSPAIHRTVFPTGEVRDGLSGLPGGTTLDVFPSMWSCHGPEWLNPSQYHRGRVCTIEHYGAGGSQKTITLCAARSAGACDTTCSTSDAAPLVGDGDWQGCVDGDGSAWAHGLSSYLDEPCDVVPLTFACLTAP
jgi:hypothetical protein